MQSVLVNDIELAFRDIGAGAPLLLVHAFPLSSAMWQPQIEGLTPSYRVIAPDLRGFGASPLGSAHPSLDQHADDLARLLDHLAIDRVIFGGLSMGGYIAFAFWRRYRERVQALILADTRPQPDTDEGKNVREQNARLAETRGAAAIADQMLPKLLSDNAPGELRAQVRQMIEANQPEGIAAALRAMAARVDSSDLLATIDVPALIVVGMEDTLTAPSVARDMHEDIPISRLVEIPNAAHLPNLEQPERFNAALREFLGGIV